jgi:hypothetical protein
MGRTVAAEGVLMIFLKKIQSAVHDLTDSIHCWQCWCVRLYVVAESACHEAVTKFETLARLLNTEMSD